MVWERRTFSIVRLHFYAYTYQIERQDSKSSCSKYSKFNFLLISSCAQFLFVRAVPKYLKYAVFLYEFNSYVYFAILPYILLMQHDLLSIHLQTSSFTGNLCGFCVCPYNVHVFKISAQNKSLLPFLNSPV